MRFFHGDGPAAQFESGNQKGGHYFCPVCEISLKETDNIKLSHNHEIRSLSDLKAHVVRGSVSKAKIAQGKIKPFEKM